MLDVLFPNSVSNPEVYRHHFIASSAVSGCEEQTRELRLLFRRLVEMIARFTNTPPLPAQNDASKTDSQIRITPSKWADVPLSEKAIPYYYRQNGTPRLFELWNAEKSRRNRANQNLSYRSDQYTPTAPAFITNPLRYDLEPYNFLRIEGHLGKSYQSVLATLLTLKSRHRLPIDIIALRTGAFDENISIDLSKEDCNFQDLEALYDTLKEELLHTLCEGVRHLYDIALDNNFPGGTPQMPLLKDCAPGYRHTAGSIGAWFEHYLTQLQGKDYIDVDQDNIDASAVLFVFCSIFIGTDAPDPKFQSHIVSIYYLMKLSEILTPDFKNLDFDDFENKYEDLIGLTRYFRNEEVKKAIPAQFSEYIPTEDLIDHFDQVLFACKLDPIRSLKEEYESRVREIKQKQFFSHFAKHNPGIQHKAGVPMGGTFILVYHQDPEPVRP